MVYGPGPFQPLIACALTVDRLDVGDIGIGDARRRAVQADAARLAERRIAVNVAAIDLEIVRHARPGRTAPRSRRPAGGCRPRLSRSARTRGTAAGSDARRGCGGERRVRVGRLNLREQRRLRRIDAGGRAGERRVRRRRANGDVPVTALGRQHEVADEGRTGLEPNRVAGRGAVDRGLQIAAGGHGDRVRAPGVPPSGEPVGGVRWSAVAAASTACGGRRAAAHRSNASPGRRRKSTTAAGPDSSRPAWPPPPLRRASR